MGPNHDLEARDWTLPSLQRTPTILVILAAVVAGFVVQTALGVDDAVDRFGVTRPDVENGEWWRLFSATYLNLHGLWHVTANLAFVAAFGPFVESALGSWRTAVVWVLGAVCGWLAMMAFGTDESTGAGSSPGATALMGAGLVTALATRDQRPSRIYAFAAGITLGVIVAVDLGGAALHLGGFLTGAAVAALSCVVKR